MKSFQNVLLAGLLLSFGSSASAQITHSEGSALMLAENIAADIGRSPDQYMGYARSLARTLSFLSPAEQERVFGFVPQPTTTSPPTTTTPPTTTSTAPKWIKSVTQYLRTLGRDDLADIVAADFQGAVDAGIIDKDGNLPTDKDGNELDPDGNIIDPSVTKGKSNP